MIIFVHVPHRRPLTVPSVRYQSGRNGDYVEVGKLNCLWGYIAGMYLSGSQLSLNSIESNIVKENAAFRIIL